MKRMAQRADFVQWDVRNWSAALDYWLAHSKVDLSHCSALELGSRDGGLSLWLALLGARVVCSDIVVPRDTTRQQHEARGISHLVRYEAIDATNIPYANEFDVIVSKSLLGAINKDGQGRAVSEMHKALKKGGELFFAENLTASPLHRYMRRTFVPWGSTWQYVTRATMDQFLAPFSKVQYKTMGFAGAFGRGERQRNLLGILDQMIFNHIVPEMWKYIIVGVARK